MPRIKVKDDAIGNRLPRHLWRPFLAGVKLEILLDRMQRAISQFYRTPELYRVRHGHEVRGKLESLIHSMRGAHLPYVSCMVCKQFEFPSQCYCHGTNYLTLDEYMRMIREHPEVADQFDTEDMKWMIPKLQPRRSGLPSPKENSASPPP